MSSFHDHVADYLNARRALGPKLEYPGFVLARFATYLEAAGARRSPSSWRSSSRAPEGRDAQAPLAPVGIVRVSPAT